MKTSEALRAFQERLLPETLRNALRTTFYKDLWAGIDIRALTLLDLHSLPITDSASLKAAGANAQLRDLMLCDEVTTSGTTAKSFVSVRSRREQTYTRRFFRAFLSNSGPALIPRAVEFTNPYHGHHLSFDVPIYTHRLSIYDRGSFERALAIINSDNNDKGVHPKCTLLFGLERHIFAFAKFVRTRFPQGLDCHLKNVTVYGHFLTTKTRIFLRETFLCAVSDQFAVSEVFGSAREADGGWYFYDPTTIAEVINPFSGEQMTEGIGRLVVTALYPFQQAQPIVRYDTGDLVIVTHTCEGATGRLGFKPLGRRRHAIESNANDEYILLPSDVYETLETYDAVKRTPLFLDSSQVTDPSGVGYPRYALICRREASGKHKVSLLIEFNEDVSHKERQSLCVGIARELLSKSPALRVSSEAKRIHFEVKPSTSFNPDFISYAE